ncbi:hypothetical protein FPV67DRAFT_1527109 [Lyophyllum atratum]|nr:hypothetical protein FPV67DRAFT_1527109 [Lyophyllum atratum]
MLPATVPQEIVEDIVGQLGEDGRTLQSCSLVSWSFRTASQPLFFHHILLLLHNTARNQRLHCVLSMNPLLASYVRSIHLKIDTVSIRPAEAICRILDVTRPHLRDLSIGGPDITFSHSWNYLHADLQNSLLSSISSPSCVGLTLGAVGFPIQYLRLFSNIRHLEMNSHKSVAVDNASDRYIFDDETRQQGYLETLAAVYFPLEHLLDHVGDPDITSSLSLSRLRFLATTLEKWRHYTFEKLLHLSGEYLEEVSILVDLDLSGAAIINFSRLSHLHILRIEIGIIQSAHGIAIVLASIPSNTVELHLTMEWEIVISVGKKGWLDIEAVLLDKWREGLLRDVVIDLHGWQGSARFLNKRMPQLVERGIATSAQ